MRAVLGIGNSGLRYQRNRHNAGFLVLDYFSTDLLIQFKAAKGDYYYSKEILAGVPFFLIKPTTYVNNSGIAAFQFVESHKIDLVDFLVVCDDVNLKTGTIRIRKNGGDGGHNGIASIIYHLNSNFFPRLRIGVGNDFSEGGLSSYVLEDFSEEDEKILSAILKNSSLLIREFISGGINAMLDANSRLFHNELKRKIN